MSQNLETVIQKLLATTTKQNPIFQTGTAITTGSNKLVQVNVGNKRVTALGYNITRPGKVTVFWDEKNKRYVAWEASTKTNGRRTTTLALRKTRPETNYLWNYNFKVLQSSSIEGFDRDIDLDLTGYEQIGITNTGSGCNAVFKEDDNTYHFYEQVGSSIVTQTSTVNNPTMYWIGNGITYRFDIENTVLQSVSSSNWTGLSLYRPTAFPNVERFAFNNAFGAIRYNLSLLTNGNWLTTSTIFTMLNDVSTQTGSGTCTNSRFYSYDDIPFWLSNGGISQRIFYNSIVGSVENNYAQKIYTYLSGDGANEVVGMEVVDYSFFVNLEFFTPDGAYPKKRYINGGYQNLSSTSTIPPITVPFANTSDVIQKNTISSINHEYNKDLLSFSSITNSSLTYIIPKVVGKNCSVYLKIEHDVSVNNSQNFALNTYYYNPSDSFLDGYDYSLSSQNNVLDYIKKSRVSQVVNIGGTCYYVSDLNGGSYTFGERFFIVLTGNVSVGSNTFTIDHDDSLLDSGKEYDIGIRYECREGLYVNKRWGTYENRTTKKIVNGSPLTYHTVSPVEFSGVNVDIHGINAAGEWVMWRGVITNADYVLDDDIGFEDGNSFRKYSSFTINVEQQIGSGYFKWYGVVGDSRIVVVPSSDYTTSLLRYLWYGGYSYESSGGLRSDSNIYIVTDENGGETVEIAIAQIPTDTAEKDEWRADIYRFNTVTLKWERRPNAISPLTQLTSASDFISYHPTPSNSRRKKRRPPR